MNPLVAAIEWMPPEKGGRLHPPTGERYITVARFSDSADDWSKDAWSVVLTFAGSSDEAHVSFLAPEAPAHLLQRGVVFELYEGRKKVANVRIL